MLSGNPISERLLISHVLPFFIEHEWGRFPPIQFKPIFIRVKSGRERQLPQ